jgi:hypothetical protein
VRHRPKTITARASVNNSLFCQIIYCSLVELLSQQLFEVAVEELELGDDLVGSRCPGEGLRVVIPVLDVGADRVAKGS